MTRYEWPVERKLRNERLAAQNTPEAIDALLEESARKYQEFLITWKGSKQ